MSRLWVPLRSVVFVLGLTLVAGRSSAAQTAALKPFDPAPAMTLPTTAGDLHLGGGQAGGESYILLGYSADSPVATEIWKSSVAELIKQSPDDVHYVFMSYGATADAVQADIDGIRRRVDEAIAELPEVDERAHWAAHFHFVTQNAATMGGPLSDLVADWGAIIAGVRAEWADAAGQAQSINVLGTTDTGWAASLADSGPVTVQLAKYGNRACGSDAPTGEVIEKIALVERGTCPFAEKAANVVKHGGAGMLMYTDDRPKARMLGSCTACHIPVAMIDREPGLQLLAALDAGSSVRVTLSVSAILAADGLAIDHRSRVREFGTIPFPFPQFFPNNPIDNFLLVAKEALYYHYEHERDMRLAQENATGDVTVLPVYQGVWADDPGWTGRRAYAEVEFPDAVAMAGYDTLEVDFGYNCPDNRKAQCPAWDYLIYLYLCDDPADPDRCTTEFGRWITPYWSGGRWVTDLSPMLALINAGGKQRFGFWTVQRYKLDMSFRLSNRRKGVVPKVAVPLLSGAPFHRDYNKHYDPIEFEVPDWADKVELVALITGHGQNDDLGCAEFCNHTHHFSINGGREHVKTHPTAGSDFGCLDRVLDGVVPNQAGTWVFGRAGWCPGLDVPPWVVDITPEVHKGEVNELTYKGLVDGKDYVSTAGGDPNTPPAGGYDARIEITSWLVYYVRFGKVFVPLARNGN